MAQIGCLPKALWLFLVPGLEENALDGINAALQDAQNKAVRQGHSQWKPVPVMGMSAADNTVEGAWTQIAGGAVHTCSVVVVAMHPSAGVEAVYNSGYSPTPVQGRLHGVELRKAARISPMKRGRGGDHAAGTEQSVTGTAAAVYNKWTSGAIDDFVAGGNILGASSFFPLGRVVGQDEGEDDELYQIIHPDSVTVNGALTFFADVHEGEALTLMTANAEQLVRLPLKGIRKRTKVLAASGKVAVGCLFTCVCACRNPI